ncbi:MAG: hypothetical protein ACE5R4_13235 [Armatimonadota bacterium]
MRKVIVILMILVAAAVAAVVLSGRQGVRVGKYNLTLNEDKQILDEKMRGFLEAIQFKHFDKAANYHNEEDKSRRPIDRLIEEKFFIKPEQLDIMSYEIMFVELSQAGDRARILTESRIRKLNTEEVRDAEAMFYWAKENGEWYLKLESSL